LIVLRDGYPVKLAGLIRTGMSLIVKKKGLPWARSGYEVSFTQRSYRISASHRLSSIIIWTCRWQLGLRLDNGWEYGDVMYAVKRCKMIKASHLAALQNDRFIVGIMLEVIVSYQCSLAKIQSIANDRR